MCSANNRYPIEGMCNTMRARHELWKEKYPDRPEARGFPFTGIANARPETIRASMARFKKSDIPFDIKKVMRRSEEFENFEAKWGIK